MKSRWSSFLLLISKRLQRRYFRKRFHFLHLQFVAITLFTAGMVTGVALLVNEVLIPRIFASDVNQNWDFSVSASYSLSDEAEIEVANNSLRLKVLNYISDAQTALLLHFDEESGNPADSSSFEHITTPSNLSYGSGQLLNAGDFDGSSSRVTVEDSNTLSLTSAHTLEAWTKFDSAFSSASHSQRQGIIDKGAYQLYYDNETGKIVYELQNSAATTWSQVAGNELNGSWDIDGQLTTNAMANDGTNLYVGLGNAIGDAEVWRWNGTAWLKIGGDGINDGWADSTFENVLSLHYDGTSLYAGLGTTAGDGEVWRWNGSAWTKIGGDAINSSWQVNMFEGVYSMTSYNGILYAGLGASANDAEVWSWDGESWTKVGGDSTNSGWTTNFEIVYTLETDGTYLYAGLGLTAGDAEVWRYSIAGGTWTRIGGDAVNSSWANSTYEYVLSMTIMDGEVYAGIGTTANDGEVWRWNGASWTQIGGDSLNSGWTTNYEGVYKLLNDGTTVYAGLGASGGDNEIWSWDPDSSTWNKIAGDGVNNSFTSTTHTYVDAMSMIGTTLYAGITSGNAARTGQVWQYVEGSWSQIGGDSVNKSWGYRGLQTVEVMHAAGEKLYAGTGLSSSGNALVWEYDGTTWSLIGGQAVNSSWAINTYETITSMISHQGELYVGLGSTANDAEVWHYDNGSWVQIGGDSLNSGWTTNFEEVNSLATLDGILYAGLGNSANDAEVWSWNGESWTKIGGDSLNSGWTTNYDRVRSLGVYRGELYAGLGATAGEAEVWRWNGSSWNKVGGDSVNSSWDAVNYEYVDSMIPFNDKLYVGLGITTDDAEVWEYDGTNWTKVGGDDVNESWTAGTYERVRTLVGYNGALFAGLGNGTGDGEIWRYRDGVWVKIAGNSTNSSWGNTIEEVTSFSPFNGKLYAGVGNTANVDAQVWVYGNNGYLESVTASHDTNWHHVAASYDGSTMRLYVDGVLDNSTPMTLTMPDTTNPVIIGSTYGGREQGKPQGFFQGMIDEVRISTAHRNSFTTTPYSADINTAQPTTAVFTSGVQAYDAFTASETANGGSITYRLSDDNGSTWKYYSGGWTTSASTAQANSATDIHTNIGSFPISSSGILWQAILDGDGTQQVTINEISIGGIADSTGPTNPDTLTALSENEGENITTNTWYGHTTPYFSWTGASDEGAGVAGYYVYFGTDNTADPVTAGSFQAGSTYSPGSMTSGQTYYLRIKARDNAQNNATEIWQAFIYKYDGSNPVNPAVISVSPAGYAATNSFTFTWPSSGGSAASDVGAGIAGYQYKTGADSGALSDWSATIEEHTISIEDAAYQEGENTFYLRTIDSAGNVSATSTTATYYFAGEGPSAPQFLTASPSTNTSNSFAFSWSVPDSHSGQASELTYCYTVNTLPTVNNCTFTSAGATSLSASAFATQVGLNTFYLVARNPESAGSAINYGAYTSATFTANTSAPGIPINIDVADISIKSSELWRLTVSWNAPTDAGSGVANYQIHSSTDGETFSLLATTTGSAYVDTDLSPQTYYYKVRACDSVSNCGAFSEVVSLLPTGKFVEPATLTSDPEVSNITTKQATISWTTDRTSDSKVSYGTSAGSYFPEEPSNATQKTDHVVSLKNLSPGTTYYYIVKWTDEDGNTGVSDEKSFSTEPAPTIADPKASSVSLTSVALEYTVKGASKVKIYYGKSSAFGGVKEVSTSTSETTYTTVIDELEDGTKYFYKINGVDSEGAEYEGNILTFETLPRPQISQIRIQQVRGTAQPTILVTWTTNTETSSIVTYYPEGNPAAARDEVNVTLQSGVHRMIIRGLQPQTPYVLIAKGRDKVGNEAVSQAQRFDTATDTRPPQISNLKVEGSNTKNGEQVNSQLVVTWTTDEQATSQIEYGEGTGSTYAQKSQEEPNLKVNHLVIISGLSPSKVYHLRALSKDSAGNEAQSIDVVSITPKATDAALDLVISNLQQVFGFLGTVQ